MAGSLTAAYSLTDTRNMSTGISPAWYAYLTIPAAALLLTPAVVTRPGWRAERRRGSGRIMLVAVGMSAAYPFVLFALRIAPVSHELRKSSRACACTTAAPRMESMPVNERARGCY